MFAFGSAFGVLAAPRECAACGHGIAAEKGNSLVRGARTPHRGDAHNAPLTLGNAIFRNS